MINREEHVLSLISYDRQYRQEGKLLAGMDEVGRGPLAGSVVTACVAIPEEPLLLWIDDSKKLSESRREKVYEEIIKHALYIGLGEIGPEEIDRINILQATKQAMRAAAAKVPADCFLIDAVTNLGLNGKEIPIIKGDANSNSIAAASILAKVTRDHIMVDYDKVYPGYGFAKHKGYGTKDHYAAIREQGVTPIHRRSFLKVIH